jgi:hypothetical protein
VEMTYCVSQRLAQKGKITIKQKLKNEIHEKVKQERELLLDKQGIERYFTPDPNNPIDQEIVYRLKTMMLTQQKKKEDAEKYWLEGLVLAFAVKVKL